VSSTSDDSRGAAPGADGVDVSRSGARAQRVGVAVQGWQHELSLVGGPNTLLWHRDLPGGTLDLTTAHPGGVAMLLAGRPTRLSDLVREPVALQQARERVRNIRHKAVELWEEHGLTTSYIAVGMATWDVPHAPRPPAAPVLLRSCTLWPTGPAELDFDVDLGPDVELNPVLLHYLRSERGLEIDGADLADRALVRKGFDPHPVYAELSRACRQVPGFRISPRLVVGTFSHEKLPMVADLAAHGDLLVDHDVVAALAGDPGATATIATTAPDWPADPDPEAELAVLDLDWSQQAAVEAVRSGVNLVVEGAPGTGKTQTIAGLVAALAADGQRVLLVSEKRAAIEAVRQRLDRVGLGDLVQADHEDPRDRRRVAAELVAALDASLVAASDAVDDDPAEVNARLVQRRGELATHLASLHDRREPWGVSAFDAQVALSAFAARPAAPMSRVRLEGAVLDGLTRDRIDELGARLTEAAELGAWTSGDEEDPWYASRFTSDEEAARALDITKRLEGGELEAARRQMAELADEAGLPVPGTLTDWESSLTLMEQVRDSLEVFRLEVFDAPLPELVAATASKEQRRSGDLDLGVLARARLTRQARALLRPGPPPPDLHGELALALGERDRWRSLAGSGARPEAPPGIEAARERFAPVLADVEWLGARLETTAAGNDLVALPLDRLVGRLRTLAGSAHRLEVVPRVLTLVDEAREAGLGPVVDDLARRRVRAANVAGELEFVWWASVLTRIAADDPGYGAHDGDRLRTVADEFVDADHAHLRSTARQVRARVAARLAEVVAAQPDQVRLLRDEAARGRRHRDPRELMREAVDVMTAVRPCWAMSPLAVASLLPPGRCFDVVVVDHAGHLPTARAVSAIARADRVVAVGDRRQSPPAQFSTVVAETPSGQPGVDDARRVREEAPGRSLMEVLARVLPLRTLERHYRSEDERLVTFVAQRVYGGASMATVPGAIGRDAVRLRTVDRPDDGAHAGSGGRGLEALAEVAAREAVEHARSHPGESLGVVAVGPALDRAVGRALSRQLARAPEVAGFFRHDAPERAFVKAADLAQGEERDAVIVVLDGDEVDEARLVVATTRARRRMTVVAPRDSGAASAGSGPSTPGGQLVADFVRYAADPDQALHRTPAPPASVLAASDATGAKATEGDAVAPAVAPSTTERAAAPSADDIHPVVSELAGRLRSEGFVVHQDHGRSGHRLEHAIEDPARPGRLLVAIESDGRGRAAQRSTRDRERISVEHLGRLGWHHVRIWTTDVFRDPARVVAMVTAEVWEASRTARTDRSQAGQQAPRHASVEPTEGADQA
jgi:hypothetical protein